MPETTESDAPTYHTSSFSGGVNCVMVARLPDGDYAVRHSRRDGPPVVFTADEWRAFLRGVRADEFDF